MKTTNVNNEDRIKHLESELENNKSFYNSLLSISNHISGFQSPPILFENILKSLSNYYPFERAIWTQINSEHTFEKYEVISSFGFPENQRFKMVHKRNSLHDDKNFDHLEFFPMEEGYKVIAIFLADISSSVLLFYFTLDDLPFLNDYQGQIEETFKLLGSNIKNNIISYEKIKKEQDNITYQLFQMEKMHNLGEFVAGFIHDLKQPLANIKFISQSLVNDIKNERMKGEELSKDLQNIVFQIDKVSNKIQHMMIFSRKSSTVNKVSVPILDLFKNIINLCKAQLNIKGIELKTRVDDDLTHIVCDANLIEQVIINLILNAKDVLEDVDRPYKKIILAAEKLCDKAITISVENNGPTIPLEIKEQIFNPFFTTKESGKGTGLGLSISMRIIEDHGGKIECQSTPSSQTTSFIITLPMHPKEKIK